MPNRPPSAYARRQIAHLVSALSVAGALLLLAHALPAQSARALSGSDCSRAAGDPCRTTIVTETSFGLQLSEVSRARDRVHVSGSLGFVTPFSPRLGIGGLATIGMVEMGLYFAVGPRLRYHITPTMAVDLSPEYQIRRETRNRGALDASVMFSDRVGVSAQIATAHAGEPIPVSLGLRLGSRPGRTSLLVGAAGAGVVGILLLMAFGSSHCGC